MSVKANFRRALLYAVCAVCAGVTVFILSATAQAQCSLNRTGETVVRFRNLSSYPLAFRVDEDIKITVPAGQASKDSVVSPGEHAFFARASSGELLTASRALVIPEGQRCIWTVTDLESEGQEAAPGFRDALKLQAVITLAIPNW
jgi:hypothetical protein